MCYIYIITILSFLEYYSGQLGLRRLPICPQRITQKSTLVSKNKLVRLISLRRKYTTEIR